jgi:hypothetical protein
MGDMRRYSALLPSAGVLMNRNAPVSLSRIEVTDTSLRCYSNIRVTAHSVIIFGSESYQPREVDRIR